MIREGCGTENLVITRTEGFGDLLQVIEQQLADSDASGSAERVECWSDPAQGHSNHTVDGDCCSSDTGHVLHPEAVLAEVVHGLADCRQPLLRVKFTTRARRLADF